MKCDALMIVFNRLEYTKKALEALIKSDCGGIYIVDNGSTDGTLEYVSQYYSLNRFHVFYNKINSITSAMNWFLKFSFSEYLVKVDPDTLIPPDFCARMIPHMKYADIVQAKHPIIKATDPGGWEGFTKNMRRANGLLYHHFVGGSGVMFKRDKIKEIPETFSPIGGWREFQRRHPELKKAFCEDVEIELLDAHGYTDYPEYYKQTGRL